MGKIDKSLFGVATEEDVDTLNEKIKTLSSNERTLTHELNLRTSLFSTFANKTDQLFGVILKNQQQLKENLQLITVSHDTNSQRQIIINQLEIILYYIQQIEQTVTFLRLGAVHPFLISMRDLQQIMINLRLIYPKERLPTFSRAHSYYQAIKPFFTQHERTIYITIMVPILHPPTPLSLFLIIPVPIKNLTILPPKPWLAIDSNDNYQWMDTEPPVIEDTFFLEEQLQNTKECFVELLRRRPAENYCKVAHIHLKSPHVEQISPTDYIVIIDSLTTIEYTCHPKGFLYKNIYQNTKITLDPHCEFYVNNLSYAYEPPLTSSTTYLLPNISLEDFSPLDFSIPSLKDIHKTQLQLATIHKVHINSLSQTQPFNYSWIIIPLLVLVILIVAINWIRKRIGKSKSNIIVSFSKGKEKVITQQSSSKPVIAKANDAQTKDKPHPF